MYALATSTHTPGNTIQFCSELYFSVCLSVCTCILCVSGAPAADGSKIRKRSLGQSNKLITPDGSKPTSPLRLCPQALGFTSINPHHLDITISWKCSILPTV